MKSALFEMGIICIMVAGAILIVLWMGTLFYRPYSASKEMQEKANAESKNDETAKNLELLAQLPGFKIEAPGNANSALVIHVNGWTYEVPRHGTKICLRYALEWFKERPEGK